MKHYLKKIVITFISLYSSAILIPAVNFGNDYKNFLLASAALMLSNIFLKPLFSLILIPVNLLTLGGISILLNLAVVFVLIYFLPQFTISPFDFTGLTFEGFVVPGRSFSYIQTVFLFTALITIHQKILHWIFED